MSPGAVTRRFAPALAPSILPPPSPSPSPRLEPILPHCRVPQRSSLHNRGQDLTRPEQICACSPSHVPRGTITTHSSASHMHGRPIASPMWHIVSNADDRTLILATHAPTRDVPRGTHDTAQRHNGAVLGRPPKHRSRAYRLRIHHALFRMNGSRWSVQREMNAGSVPTWGRRGSRLDRRRVATVRRHAWTRVDGQGQRSTSPWFRTKCARRTDARPGTRAAATRRCPARR